MSRFEINSIKLVTSENFVLPNNTDCTICRQSLNSFSIYAKDNDIREITHITGSCGHTFHKECILPWLKNSNKCPICSKTMNITINKKFI